MVRRDWPTSLVFSSWPPQPRRSLQPGLADNFHGLKCSAQRQTPPVLTGHCYQQVAQDWDRDRWMVQPLICEDVVKNLHWTASLIIVTQMSSRASKSTEKRWCTSLHHWRDFRWKLVECDWCLVTSIRQRLSTLHWLPPLITSEQSKCSCRSDRCWAPGFNERRHRLVNTVAHALSRSWTGRLFYAFRNKHV